MVVVVQLVVVVLLWHFFADKKFMIPFCMTKNVVLVRKEIKGKRPHPRGQTEKRPQESKTIKVCQISGLSLITYQEVYFQTSLVCFCDQTHPVRCPGTVLLTASNFSADFCLANKTPRNL